ncbi:MAG: M43 family zinc metalloprotease [Luteibaculum sp.]
MKQLFTGLLLLLILGGNGLFAQKQKCGTDILKAKKIAENPELAKEYARLNKLEASYQRPEREMKGGGPAILTIPTVVHVLYNSSEENISDQQIYNQILALNEDFRLNNSDSLQPNHPFWLYTADSGLEFCLAQQDPNGNPTNGITRTFTQRTSFTNYEDEKYTSEGGKDNWDPTRYLNIWVCNLGEDGLLGYATPPASMSAFPEEDGVVIDYRAFGFGGTAGSPPFEDNALGRTGVHEVGHWLNLDHIWGDDFCGDDFVDDTPPAEDANYGCSSFPLNPNNSCGSDQNGEMYMNYMDYSDDYCLVMFTFDQVDRMYSAIENGRPGLVTSRGCTAASIQERNFNYGLQVYPNPVQQVLFLQSTKELDAVGLEITVHDPMGRQISVDKNGFDEMGVISLNTEEWATGLYYIVVKSNLGKEVFKVSKN